MENIIDFLTGFGNKKHLNAEIKIFSDKVKSEQFCNIDYFVSNLQLYGCPYYFNRRKLVFELNGHEITFVSWFYSGKKYNAEIL